MSDLLVLLFSEEVEECDPLLPARNKEEGENVNLCFFPKHFMLSLRSNDSEKEEN